MKATDKNLAHFFKNVILMSGTPDWVQQEMTARNKRNECKCSPKLAMDNGWICKPSLNLVDCDEKEWPAAVKAVFDREMKIWNESGKIFKPNILVNCKSIDDVANLRNVPWFKDNAGKLFHLVSIHSKKTVHDSTGSIVDLTAEVDGKQVEAEEAYNEIMSIDETEDSVPNIVFQVQMIGEGINVKSFNAVVTASNCDKTAMQQIGRAIRDFTLSKTCTEKVEVPSTSFFGKLFKKKQVIERECTKTFSKVHDGHASVYVINDNLKTLTNLVVGLSNYDLTSSCFTWGSKTDLNEGSSPETLETADSCKMQDAKWHDMSNADPDIIEVISSAKRRVLVSCFDKFFDGSEDNDGNGIPDAEEFKDLLVKKRDEGWIEAWTGKKVAYDPYDMMAVFKDRVSRLLGDDAYKTLWSKCRKTALVYAVQDPVMAEFLDTHLSEKTFESFEM